MYKYIVCSLLLIAFVCSYGVNSQTYTLGINELPEFDICAHGGDALSCSNHGSCVNSACVCTDGYTGRDCSTPPGGFRYPNPIPKARATMFANLDGSDGQLEQTTCFGNFPGGQWVSKAFLPVGVTGIAAVNPTVYGSRFAFGGPNQYSDKSATGSYSGVGQSCGHCFNLTKGGNSAVVMVVNRCGGFCQSHSAVGPCATNGTTSTDCGYCVTPTTTPTTIGCSCMSAEAIQTNGYCDASKQHHCDHCAQNDHPHFDLDTDSLSHLCGSNNAGVCDLDSFQWVQCGGIQAQPGTFPNGGTPYVLPSNAVASGVSQQSSPSSTQAPSKPTAAASTPKPTTTPAATPKPTPKPTPKSTPKPTPKPSTKPNKHRPTAAPTEASRPAPATPTTAPATPTPPISSSQTTCTDAQSGQMRCTDTAGAYQTCDHGKWQAAQSCGAGLVCQAASPYIYCVRALN